MSKVASNTATGKPVGDRSVEAGRRFYAKVRRAVRRLARERNWESHPSAGEVARAVRVSVDDLIETIEGWGGYWICCLGSDGLPKEEWQIFEEGE